MNPVQTARVATRALLRNKLRSFLTTLGIIIGVGAVIAMVAFGEGAKARVESAFASMGTNMLVVQPGSTAAGGARGGYGSMPTLTWEDLTAIQGVSSVARATAVLQGRNQVASEDSNWNTSVVGTTPDYFEIRNWHTAIGRPFSQSDADSGTKIAILGATVAEKLFGANTDPTGQLVRIRGNPFEVIGVLEAKGQSPMGQDYDDTVIVPLRAYQTKLQGGLQKFVSGQILVSAITSDDTQRAENQITNLLRDRHRLSGTNNDDFQIRNLTEMAEAQEEGTKTLTLLLASIAAVSLLVGGIGIMNIMLVSVTERTREIGVRMAVGAKPRHILAQFLMEALALSVLGGILGILAGLGTAEWLGQHYGWPILIRVDIIVIAVAFSGLVGIGFGLYPAHKASQLDPIQALRYE
jgi:putative ABC transport system permease protein